MFPKDVTKIVARQIIKLPLTLLAALQAECDHNGLDLRLIEDWVEKLALKIEGLGLRTDMLVSLAPILIWTAFIIN